MQVQKDSYYISKVLDGEVNAFSFLIDRYKDYVYHVALKIVKNDADAEEVTQDCFLKAYKSLDTFSQKSKFSSWLYKIAYYTAISKTRNKYNQLSTSLDDHDIKVSTVSNTVSALDSIKHSEQKKYINEAMEQMPENMQLILSLHYLKECSVKEVAEITGLSVTNIKTILFRGRKALYINLEKILEGELKSII